MENNRNFPARQFHSLTFFAGLCIGITPVAQALAAEGQTNADDTLVVEASTPSLYAPQQSADPKFSRPVADTTRTMTVISEQVIKDQGATNLTDAPRDKCTLSCAINGIHAAFHYLKKNYISGCVMTVPTGW